jgi:hypothetical protein
MKSVGTARSMCWLLVAVVAVVLEEVTLMTDVVAVVLAKWFLSQLR